MPSRPFFFRAAALSAAALASLPTLSAQLTPAFARSSTALGRQAPSTPIAATVYLKLHDKAALDAAVEAMYTPDSSSFHHFATPDAIRQYAPTSAEVAAVKKELAAHNLKVVSTDPMNLSVKISGLTSDFEAAFHTGIMQYQVKTGGTIGTTSAAPSLGGAASGLVASVAGIGAPSMHPHAVHPVDPETGKATGIVPVAGVAKPNGAFYSPQCFYQPSTEIFTKGATAAAYSGLNYGASNTDTTPGTLAPCAYSPQDLYRIYGLNPIYGRGYTGRGQTVAIVDAYGSPTITQDLAAFNSIYNLPTANFRILTPTPVTIADAGFAGETTLDVEYVHAIAPAAAIALVLAPTAQITDLEDAIMYIIQNRVADIISNSYGIGELQADAQSVTSFDEILELAAFTGISAQFSSGDSGDYAAVEMGAIDVSSPADSPYATAVGGTSTAFSPTGGSIIQTGWGNNLTRLNSKAGGIDNPPQIRGFIFGAGGGTSQYFRKPAYQSALKGTGRLLPDVSALADPFTGVEIIQTIDGTLSYEAIGGTSLAAPIFSAEWALLQQRFGFPLGQAAPLIAQFGTNPSVITDVLPAKPIANVIGAIRNNFGAITNFSSDALIGPSNANSYLSALYTSSAGSTFDLSFGTDSSLAVTPGFDFVTGWGVLNMPGIFNLLVR